MLNVLRTTVIAFGSTHADELAALLGTDRSEFRTNVIWRDRLYQFGTEWKRGQINDRHFITRTDGVAVTWVFEFETRKDADDAMHDQKYGGGDPENGGAPFGYQRSPRPRS